MKHGWLGIRLAIGCLTVAVHLWGSTTLVGPWVETRYWQSAGFAAVTPLVLSGPLICGWAALETWRQRRAMASYSAPVRRSATVLWHWMTPVAATVLVVTMATWILIATQATGEFVWAAAGAAAVLPLAGFGVLGWGMAVGRLLPVGLAVPAAAVVCYLTWVWPISQSDFVFRHMVGVHMNCCFLERQPAAGAIVAPAVLWTSIGVAAALGAVLAPRSRSLPLILTLITALLAFATMSPIVKGLDVDGSEPRDQASLRCVGSAPAVCLWPEHDAWRTPTTVAVARVAATLKDVGVPVPAAASEAFPAEWTIVAQPRADQALQSVASGLTAVEPPACSTSQPWPMGRYQRIMGVWLSLRSGVAENAISAGVSPDMITQAKTILALSNDRQGSWFATNLHNLQRCNVEPVEP